MFEFLSYSVPWWAWGIPSGLTLIGLFFIVTKYFGHRNAIYATAIYAFVALLALIDRRGRQKGWQAREEKGNKDAENIIKRVEAARHRTRTIIRDNPDRLRDDDGFRRE